MYILTYNDKPISKGSRSNNVKTLSGNIKSLIGMKMIKSYPTEQKALVEKDKYNWTSQEVRLLEI